MRPSSREEQRPGIGQRISWVLSRGRSRDQGLWSWLVGSEDDHFQVERVRETLSLPLRCARRGDVPGVTGCSDPTVTR
jgi:hypothetical protein